MLRNRTFHMFEEITVRLGSALGWWLGREFIYYLPPFCVDVTPLWLFLLISSFNEGNQLIHSMTEIAQTDHAGNARSDLIQDHISLKEMEFVTLGVCVGIISSCSQMHLKGAAKTCMPTRSFKTWFALVWNPLLVSLLNQIDLEIHLMKLSYVNITRPVQSGLYD